jgi:hypothetical protein
MAAATTAGFPSSSNAPFASKHHANTASTYPPGPSASRYSYNQPMPSFYSESPNLPHLRPDVQLDDGPYRGDTVNHSRRPPPPLERDEVDKTPPPRGDDASPDHKRQRIGRNIPSLDPDSSATGNSTQIQASESLPGDHKDILRRRRSSSLRPSRKVPRRSSPSALQGPRRSPTLTPALARIDATDAYIVIRARWRQTTDGERWRGYYSGDRHGPPVTQRRPRTETYLPSLHSVSYSRQTAAHEAFGT